MSGQKRKRPKSYYIKCANQNAKRARHNCLEVGMKGFLITCGSKEEFGVRESLNILNEYADRLYGPESSSNEETAGGAAGDKTGQGESKEDGSEEEEDIEKALEKEVTALKDNTPQSKRFQRLNCPARNCIFIKSNMEEDPLDLTLNILRDIAETNVPKSRYAQRILPVQATCKVFYDDILKCIGNVVEPFFRCPFGTKRTFSIMFKCRNNYSISKEKLQAEIGRLLREMNPLNECVYRDPDRIILVEICNKVCCIAMVHEFYELKKFNLIEVATLKVDGEKPDPNKIKHGSLSTVSGDKTVDSHSLESGDEDKTKTTEEKTETVAPSETNQDKSQSNDNLETSQVENCAENKSENNQAEKKSESIPTGNESENNPTENKSENNLIENKSENNIAEYQTENGS